MSRADLLHRPFLPAQVDSLILSVRQIYHAPNPYHNYIHATDVLQATYTFLALTGLVPPFALLGETSGKPAESWKRPADLQGRVGEVMRPEDIFAVVVAAIGHDAAHPGLSNVFMVRRRSLVHLVVLLLPSLLCLSRPTQKNAKTPLSQVYNDTSVLENMHCLLITTLLRKHGFAFLFEASPKRTGLSDTAPDWTGFRKVLFSSIMATDMAMHFSWIVRLGQLGDKIAEGRCSMEEDEVWEDRIMICQALIKCSDISNPVRLCPRILCVLRLQLTCGRFLVLDRLVRSTCRSIGRPSSSRSGPSRLSSRPVFICPSRSLKMQTLLCKPKDRWASSTSLCSRCSILPPKSFLVRSCSLPRFRYPD